MLTELAHEELEALAERLWRGWTRASEVYPLAYEDSRFGGRNRDIRNPIVDDLERTYQPVMNEYWSRYLGCRWQACTVCRHASCRYCPTCNPDEIAPNGEAYDDTEDTPDACC